MVSDNPKNKKLVGEYFAKKYSALEAREKQSQFFKDQSKLDQSEVQEIMSLIKQPKKQNQFSRIVISQGQIIELK